MHENHRERLRERFLKEGFDSFEPHQALEMLLFYSVPRKDTNELAHRLIDHYGSLSGVLDSNVSELEHVEGVGRNSAVLLSMLKPLWRIYRKESSRHGLLLDSCGAACTYAVDLFAGRIHEAFYVLCLDTNSRLIREVLLQEGTINEVSVHPRTVMEAVLRCNAAKVILVHNHPIGSPEPSSNDLAYTRRLAAAFSIVGVDIVDHIIVSGEASCSFARDGYLEKILREADLKGLPSVYSDIK